MNIKSLIHGLCFASGLFLAASPLSVRAQVPCLVFTGNSGVEKAVDLSEFNRISFGGQAMILTSSSNPDKTPLDLPYAEYNRFAVRNATPTGVKAANASESFGPVYFAATNEIGISSPSAEPVNIEVYNVAGMKVVSNVIYPGERVSIANAPKGVYLVVTTCGSLRSVSKIVKN